MISVSMGVKDSRLFSGLRSNETGGSEDHECGCDEFVGQEVTLHGLASDPAVSAYQAGKKPKG